MPPRLLYLLLGLLAGCSVYSGTPWQTLGAGVRGQPPLYRTIAILPMPIVEVQVRGFTRAGQPDTTAATRQRMGRRGEKLAYSLQAALYAQLRAGQPRQGCAVWLQPARETNLRLQQAGLTYDSLLTQTPEHLQQVLGVDALLTGQTLLAKIPASVAMVSGLPSFFATTRLILRDFRTPQPLWQANLSSSSKELLPGLLASSDFASQLMQVAPVTFPYR